VSEQGGQQPGGESMLTVLIALGANVLIAIAKSVVAALTGSASMVAEAAHSWADSGNETFLVIAERRAAKPADDVHPYGHGREAFVWSMFAAVGLFAAGAVVSVWHGITSLLAPEPEGEAAYLWAYIVLAVAFVLEGISFLQARRQTRRLADRAGLSTLPFIVRTSNPTLRAVFFEDAAALIGIVLAATGLALHEITGDARWDAAGSIAVGLLLAALAIFLIQRNRELLVGEAASPAMRERVMQALLRQPRVERVSLLHLEFVGPGKLLVIAAVDLVGDDPESDVARELGEIGDGLEQHEQVARAFITLSRPAPRDDPR
jgi:cation diffusion facilitator family transporter